MPRVLVTGINGFVGSHVAVQLLKSGYQVRGTVRGNKLESFKNTTKEYPSLEVVPLDDVVTGDLSTILEGVDSVIHVAVPIPFGAPNQEENLKFATEGTLNVIRQAVDKGIQKVVVTSSWGAVVDPNMKQAFEGVVTTEKDWGQVTKDEFVNGTHDPSWSYLASKVLAEKAAWEFARNTPSLDLATIAPPFIYGPFAPGFPVPKLETLGSNAHIYTLLKGIVPPPLPPAFCDVRDVARAHVAALNVPPASTDVEDKRFLVSSGPLIWKDAVEHLHQSHPDIISRLPATDAEFLVFPGPPATIDATRAKEKLGMKEYIGWKQTIDDTIDALLNAEKV